MAQLTWRNVDAPNMSGVTDALRLAGQSLTSGLNASREALESFQKTTSQDESARALAATIGVSDPTKLKEILGGYNPSYLTPAAVEAISKRPQEGANLAQTQAQTTSTNISNDFNRVNNPLKIEGTRLDNQGKVASNAKAAFDNEVAKKQHEAAPAWNQELAQYRADKANPDPAAQARAATRAASPDFAAKANAAGITGSKFSDVLDKGDAAVANAVKLTGEYLKLDEAKRTANLASTSRAMTENLIQAWGGPAGALRAAQENPDMPVELRNEVVKQITAAAPNYRTPQSESEIQAAPSQPAAAAPVRQSQTPTLDFFTAQAKAAGLEVTSGFRGPDHPLTRANPNSAHAQGRAFDLRARTTDDADRVIAKQREIFSAQGMVEGRDYKIIDEVRSPAGHATGPHVHVQLTPEGAAKQGGGGDRVQQILARAGQPLAAPDLRGPGGPVRQLGPAGGLTASAAAAAVTPGVRLETVDDFKSNYGTLNSMLSSVATTSSMDAQLNPAAPIAEAFNNPKQENTTAMAVAAQLHKLGGDKDEGGLFSRSKLSVREINDAVQTVVTDYKVSPAIAGALIESAVKTTNSWVPLLGSGGRKVDYDQLKTYIDRFVDKDGKPKTELVQMMGQKKAIEEQATSIKDNLKAEREIWLQARSAASRGNSRVDVKAVDERYRNAQRAADAMGRALRNRPAVEGNSRANTGR